MKLVTLGRAYAERTLRHRRMMGGDRFDEVWNGTYVLSPIADNEHQTIATVLAIGIGIALSNQPDVLILAGTNISDQRKQWVKNYRCPDVAVFLSGHHAEDRRTHWLGGPDFAVEVISHGDRSRKKFDFYAKVQTRELLLVNRNPWRLELYELSDGQLRLRSESSPGSAHPVMSSVLGVNLRLRTDQPRPRIEFTRPEDNWTWLG